MHWVYRYVSINPVQMDVTGNIIDCIITYFF